jgi:hypothetical protein
MKAAAFFITVLVCCWNVRGAGDSPFVPLNPPEMKRLTDSNSPAHQAAKLFMRGANLGNYLEAPPGQNWGVKVSANEFSIMKREGFDHVRVPVGWQYYTGPGPDFTLSSGIFARTDFVVTNALAAKLAVIINVHNFDAFTSNPGEQTDRFLAIWRQIAAHYASFTNLRVIERTQRRSDYGGAESNFCARHCRDSQDRFKANDLCRAGQVEPDKRTEESRAAGR